MDDIRGWATCSATQLGFLRISLNPRAVNTTIGATEALRLLRELVSDPRHKYLDSMPAPAESSDAFLSVMGHQQITDTYLVWVARYHKARFLTFDTRLRSFENIELLGI